MAVISKVDAINEDVWMTSITPALYLRAVLTKVEAILLPSRMEKHTRPTFKHTFLPSGTDVGRRRLTPEPDDPHTIAIPTHG